MPTAYCGDCDWKQQVADGATTELDRAMIDHHVETGHSPIERADLVEPISAVEFETATASECEREETVEVELEADED